MARALGIGGATGLGSIVYAFAVMAKCLRDDDLLTDAHDAALLFTDELIGADKQLDVMGGSAGAILALLRLYRDSGSADGARPRRKMRRASVGSKAGATPMGAAAGSARVPARAR